MTRTTLILLVTLLIVAGSQAQLCPWQNDHPELSSACLCASNLAQELSVQCDLVEWSLLLVALKRHLPPGPGPVIDLLYISNSTIRALPADTLVGVRKVRSLQLSGCRIERIEANAFRGHEGSMRNLNLQDNMMEAVPVAALRPLKNLTLLDLSRNRLSRVAQDAFSSLSALTTLKLADNELTLEPGAFHGLEDSLRNLNLKGTRQKRLPEAVRGLKALAFLDLAQNGLRELPPPSAAAGRTLQGLESLTAINLERNLIQSVAPDAFAGVADTLSSLSLLNNLLTDFPTPAISTLKELRVLDIGFNLITTLPPEAFSGTPSLTLLALDGNPLAHVPEVALANLNATLRGLSLGGRFLRCDCRLKWLAKWLLAGELQVTSRERAPQFCGEPPRLRDRAFPTIQPEELTCEPGNEIEDSVSSERTPSTPETVTAAPVPAPTTSKTPTRISLPPRNTTPRATSTTSTTSTTTPRSITTTSTTTTTTRAPSTSSSTTTPTPSSTTQAAHSPPPARITGSANVLMSRVINPSATTPAPARSTLAPRPAAAIPGRGTQPHHQPSLILGGAHRPKVDEEDEVIVKGAQRVDSSVVITWDSRVTNLLGFRVVYRLFGDRSFKQGPPLDASEREFKIKNVPPQECLVVCVVSLEEVRATPDTVPPRQCREVRTEQRQASSSTGSIDRVTVAASAAVCGVVLLAVLALLIVSRRRARKLGRVISRQQAAAAAAANPAVLTHGLCPHKAANLLLAGGGISGPMSTIGAPGSHFHNHQPGTMTRDWDGASMYSARSIPRPRVLPSSHHGSVLGCDPAIHAAASRSIADGQSQRSFSALSAAKYLSPGGGALARPDLRQSRQSLAAPSERLGSRMGSPTRRPSSQAANRARSRSRESLSYLEHQQQQHEAVSRPASRCSSAMHRHHQHTHLRAGTNTSGYDTSDNWTDHDMDIYMARNPTRGSRNSLVRL